MDFKNQHVLITGASAGLGLEFARQFHKLGARVFLVARREDLLRNIVAELNRARPDSADMMVVDLANQDRVTNPSLLSLLTFVRDNRVDVLVNNAGRGTFGRFEDLNLEAEIEMVNLNIVATMRLTHAVIPQMKERRSGAILNVSSVAGFQPLPFMATYAGTKAFDYHLGMALRHELSDFGVRVVTLCPGPTETEFGRAADVPQGAIDFSDSASMVVAKAIRGLQCNRAVILPGWRAGLMGLAVKFLPRGLSTLVSKKAVQKSVQKPI